MMVSSLLPWISSSVSSSVSSSMISSSAMVLMKSSVILSCWENSRVSS